MARFVPSGVEGIDRLFKNYKCAPDSDGVERVIIKRSCDLDQYLKLKRDMMDAFESISIRVGAEKFERPLPWLSGLESVGSVVTTDYLDPTVPLLGLLADKVAVVLPNGADLSVGPGQRYTEKIRAMMEIRRVAEALDFLSENRRAVADGWLVPIQLPQDYKYAAQGYGANFRPESSMANVGTDFEKSLHPFQSEYSASRAEVLDYSIAHEVAREFGPQWRPLTTSFYTRQSMSSAELQGFATGKKIGGSARLPWTEGSLDEVRSGVQVVVKMGAISRALSSDVVTDWRALDVALDVREAVSVSLPMMRSAITGEDEFSSALDGLTATLRGRFEAEQKQLQGLLDDRRSHRLKKLVVWGGSGLLGGFIPASAAGLGLSETFVAAGVGMATGLVRGSLSAETSPSALILPSHSWTSTFGDRWEWMSKQIQPTWGIATK